MSGFAASTGTPREIPNKIPNAISKHIINYYVNHADVLLNDTNLRSVSQNNKRSQAYKSLLTELKEEFGFELSEKRLRNHFDYMRNKIIQKGMAHKRSLNAEKRYRGLTGGGRSLRDENAFANANEPTPFESSTEQALWEYFDNTPTTVPFKEGESSVGKRKRAASPDDELVSSLSPEPNMDDFLSDSEDGRPRHQRFTEKDILEEQILLCQDQRKFFRKLMHTLDVFTDYVMRQQEKSQGIQETKQPKITPLADPNIEESVFSIRVHRSGTAPAYTKHFVYGYISSPLNSLSGAHLRTALRTIFTAPYTSPTTSF
ncbi:unnamed protein product [Cylicocyclus nassatus]|uniref:Uncharacterized protein n=1 Tax=Cylicocyclus nassatus TaxID=53992 RepID=A0AA36DPB3_CYLNA|nr:unnamed protein product [Cylicocyclus nassatus]